MMTAQSLYEPTQDTPAEIALYTTPRELLPHADLTASNTNRFRVCDKLFRTSRNYKHVLAYLEKADADCQRRSGQMLDYQGVVVVNPGSELSLVPCWHALADDNNMRRLQHPGSGCSGPGTG